MSDNKITYVLLRGHTDTMILRLLSESERYGYEIVKQIAERSGSEYELKEATMYSSGRCLLTLARAICRRAISRALQHITGNSP